MTINEQVKEERRKKNTEQRTRNQNENEQFHDRSLSLIWFLFGLSRHTHIFCTLCRLCRYGKGYYNLLVYFFSSTFFSNRVFILWLTLLIFILKLNCKTAEWFEIFGAFLLFSSLLNCVHLTFGNVRCADEKFRQNKLNGKYMNISACGGDAKYGMGNLESACDCLTQMLYDKCHPHTENVCFRKSRTKLSLHTNGRKKEAKNGFWLWSLSRISFILMRKEQRPIMN